MQQVATRSQSPTKASNLPSAGDFDLHKITPELAAKIVKHFILPMFDNSASTRVGRRLGHKQSLAQGGSSSIYGELKLSEKLNETLSEVRNEVRGLTQSLEEER